MLSFGLYITELLSTIPIDLNKVNVSDIDKEILRAAIIGELDAINLYEQMAARAKSEKLKKVLLDIAKEEKTHVGEFKAVLDILDKEQKQESLAGEKEVKKIIS